MALSDYATMAFDTNGKPCGAAFVHPRLKKNFVEIYKTRVHVGAEGMWQEDDSSYIKPFIASINEGDMNTAGFSINAFRYRDNVVFVHASAYDVIKFPREEKKDDQYIRHYFCGIGAYGYAGHRWIGIGKGMFLDFKRWLTKMEKEYIVDKEYAEKISISNALFYSQGDEFIAQHTKNYVGGLGQKIGKPRTPILMQAIRHMKKGRQK